MTEHVVAAVLEVPVEANTKGFKERLRAALEKEAAGLAANVGIDFDEAGLKEQLKAKVERAARGVKAKVEVEVDEKKGWKERFKNAVGKLRLEVEDVTDDVERERAAAEVQARRKSIMFRAELTRRRLLAAVKAAWAEAQAEASRRPVRLPVTTDDDGDDGDDGKKKPGNPGMPRAPGRAMWAFKPLLMLSLLSVLQPLIATIVGGLGALVPMVLNLGTALSTVVAILPGLAGLLAIIGAGMLIFSGWGEKGKYAVASMRKIKKEVKELAPLWKDLTHDVRHAFWDQLVGKIKPLGQTFLPLLKTGLVGVSKELGASAARLAEWGKSDIFQSRFKSVMATSKTLTGQFARAFEGLLDAFMDLSHAAGPLAERIGGAFERWSAALSKKWDTKESIDKLREFLDYSADKGAQAWRILKDIGGAIAGIFRAGKGSGDSLLESLEKITAQWHKWTDSEKGRERIKKWFEKVEPIARELGNLIIDVGKALARLSEDDHTAKLLKRIRDELLPAVEKFLKLTGETLGPKVVEFFTELAKVLAEMSSAGGPLSVGLGYLSNALRSIGDFLRSHPNMATMLGTILGALMAYRALSFMGQLMFGPLIKGFQGLGSVNAAGIVGLGLAIAGLTGNLHGFSPMMAGVTSALGAFLGLRLLALGPVTAALAGIGPAISAIRTANAGSVLGAGAGGLAGSINGVKNALGIAGTAAMGALGGPVGLAFAGIAIGVGLWSAAKQKANEEGERFKTTVDQIVASLKEESGALTEATKATIAKQLQESGLADKAQKLGLNLEIVTQAAMGNAAAQAQLARDLTSSVIAASKADGSFANLSATVEGTGYRMTDLIERVLQGPDAIMALNSEIQNNNDLTYAQKSNLQGTIGVLDKMTKAQQEVASETNASSDAVAKAVAQHQQFQQLTGASTREVKGFIEQLRLIPDGESVEIDAMTEDAKAKLREFGYKVETLEDGTVKVTANTKAAENAISWAARNRSATITATVVQRGQKMWFKDGGMVEFFAGGGVKDWMKNISGRARRGVENHVAQIAPAGSWRVWGEPETGGEAYIPLGPSKRRRSMAILREVAERFGLMLAPRVRSLSSAMAVQQQLFDSVRSFSDGAAIMGRSNRFVPAMAGGRQITFEAGAIQVINPKPETAGQTVQGVMERINDFGLFGKGDE